VLSFVIKFTECKQLVHSALHVNQIFKAEEDANRKEQCVAEKKDGVAVVHEENNMRQRVVINQSTESINEPAANVFVESEVSLNRNTM
jgi:hypothetical protein